MGGNRSYWWALGIAALTIVASLTLPLHPDLMAATAPIATPGSVGQLTPAGSPSLAPSAAVLPAPRLAPSAVSLPHYPVAWGPSHLPPGAPMPALPAGRSPAQYASSWLNGIPYVDGSCYGRWSAGGQSTYAGGCYGHDEPALNPFSDLVGSGGNVSWNVSLPVDRSPTQNQSDLYAAVWFGMNLYDPYGYDGQCFLELQLYPDTNANYTQQSGVWSAFAVAWQIELANGFEDPCFQAPLVSIGTHTPIVFNQGDHLNITMTGWLGSKKGENIAVKDLTSGGSAFLNLYNHSAGYPLDPAYRVNNIDDSLPWSPGGDLPVSFAFEAGHTYVGPSNNLYGGCSAGVPPPSPLYPSTPCPSYDPQSWANDTLVPWHFYPTVFFNAHARQTATQVGFIQDFGAQAWMDPLSQGSCIGGDGSQWCAYPWYSYLGALHAYTFGAVDFLGTTADFGKFMEYATQLEGDSSGLGYFPVTNFTVPGSPGATLTIAIHGSGAVYFLNHVYTGSGTLTKFTVNNLSNGPYSVNAVAKLGSFFASYAGGTGVTMDATTTAWSSLRISASGTVAVTFAKKAHATVSVTFTEVPNSGSVGLDPGFIYPILATYPSLPAVGGGIQVAPTAATLANGTSQKLVPGMYSFQAYPDPGEEFVGWTASRGIALFTPESNQTWANVTQAGSVVAHFQTSAQQATVVLTTVPAQGGTISLNGRAYSNGAVVTVPEGAYNVTANPAPSYTFDTWSALWSATMTNFSRSSVVQVQNGSSFVDALFSSTPMVRMLDIGGGAILLNGVNVSGQLVPLAQVVNSTYPIIAAPYPGHFFVYWNVSPTANLTVLGLGNAFGRVFVPIANLSVNGSGQLIAFFGPYPKTLPYVPYHIGFTPGSGTIVFNGIKTYTTNGTSVNLVSGLYALSEVTPTGQTFQGWLTTGLVSVTTDYVPNALGEWQPLYKLSLTGNGTITARFDLTAYPVTFVDTPSATGGIATFSGSAGTFVEPSGSTALLPAGTYTVSLSGGTSGAANWTGTSNLTVTGALTGLSTTVVVAGSGTLFALAVSEPVVGAIANPATTGSNLTTQIQVTVFGGTAEFSYFVGPDPTVPPGTITCTPGNSTSPSNTSVATCVSTSTGTFVIDVQVTDALGYVTTTSVSVRFA